MELLDIRRLTGANVIWERPGAVLDLRCSTRERAALAARWQALARTLLDAVGWSARTTRVHQLHSGVALALSAPLDALYAATEMQEYLWEQLSTPNPERFEAAVARIQRSIAEESQPDLLALQKAAKAAGLDFLSDDEEVSVGTGRGAQSWPVARLPAVADVAWRARQNIPIGLVTGTNGKTTTVRLLSRIAQAAGRRPGVCSTDWIGVDGEILERGDYAGPGGARSVLRHPAVDLAILETARGGLLRRGLGTPRADAALITNIAEDHLGDFGSETIDELLAIKWVVHRALGAHGCLVLNAEDSRLVAKARDWSGHLIWFGRDPAHEVLRQHHKTGGRIVTIRDAQLICAGPEGEQDICAVADIPITVGGLAQHNVANALAAAALAWALNLPGPAIADGLRSLAAADNPGRCNLVAVRDFQVLVDFAHNPQGMEAILDMARALPARRRLLAFSQAGDRTDVLIRDMARVAWASGLDRVLVAELAAYYRGRQPGEVYGLLRDELIAQGARAEQIAHYEWETESLEAALQWAGAGDLIIMLALGQRQDILRRLDELARLPGPDSGQR